MKSNEVRKSFLDFFRDKGHTIVPSSPVVPVNDPTLLFTNAGMNQFKDVFLGTGKREYSRAADTQKCIRAGGKHNDLEEVGNDGYHHTFFEMLGNWSFGDYYKKEAIVWAWELLTDVWKLDKKRLWVTVFETDEEAFEIWSSETDVDPSHILRFGEKDNFWEMGETGPCGPCSEIHYDNTDNGCKAEDVNAGIEEVVEIWNLVFIQYNRKKDRELELLPKKHVDTGMGFERIVRVLQKKNSNYETDIFLPLIKKISEITGKEYKGKNIPSINAIADHIRCLTFAISDGAIPSNEGRGYVLRRILRRASNHASKLDFNEPILYRLVDTLIDIFGGVFPEIISKKDFTKEVIKAEEESFHLTLERGIKLFNEIAGSLSDTKIFPGVEAFKLYDTFGFPLDLTQVMAREIGLKVDILRFEEEMEKQKERGKSSRKETAYEFTGSDLHIENTGDVKYDPYEVKDEEFFTEMVIPDPEKNIIVLKTNPFFSESGGQISDTGIIETSSGRILNVVDSKKNFLITDITSAADLKEGEVKVVLNRDRRNSVERNHSATHLLHEALRRILGDHIKQHGSLVSDEYLRFDFPHFHKVSDEQVKDIEELVNSKISEEIEVYTDVDISIEKANRIPNVKKLFGEKYGDKVRVVHIDDSFSVEFCGGTHVSNTSDIGLFKIIKEESIASGTRRIFARTGKGIIKYLSERISDIDKISEELPEKYTSDLRSALITLNGKISGADFRDIELMRKLIDLQDNSLATLIELKDKYSEERKNAEKELLKKNVEIIFGKIDKITETAEQENGVTVIASKIEAGNTEEFKEIGEYLRRKVNNGVALIAAVIDGKINLVCSVSDNLVKEKNYSAGKIISKVARELGGGGGGKPHLATAGAKDLNKLQEVLDRFETYLEN
ncbi:MAG: alanine--tRNA ligase [Bacteroidetes bacterium]|nr:alanine--tRNA ligase [Bacteroidota bacterium]